MLFRRKRRVLRTRGVLWERAAGAVLHKGPNLAFVGLERVVFPPWGENRLTGPHGGQQRLSRSVLLGAKKPLSGFVGQRLWGL